MKKFFIPAMLICLFSITIINDSFAQQSSDDSEYGKKKGRPDVPGTFLIELGWNLLQDEPFELENSPFGSRTLNMYYFYDIQIAKSGFFLMPGIGVGLDRYKFDGDYTLIQSLDADGVKTVDFADISAISPKKSMLITNYLDIPLEVRFYSNPGDRKRSFNVGFGGKAGFRFSSLTKVKYSEDGNNAITKIKKDFDLNRFRYGLVGRIGIGGFNAFYYHSFSTLFDGDAQPAGTEDTANITVGLSFTGF